MAFLNRSSQFSPTSAPNVHHGPLPGWRPGRLSSPRDRYRVVTLRSLRPFSGLRYLCRRGRHSLLRREQHRLGSVVDKLATTVWTTGAAVATHDRQMPTEPQLETSAASTLIVPRIRALRPPCLRRIKWPSLRSIFGLVVR